jgi:hypothetical protein
MRPMHVVPLVHPNIFPSACTLKRYSQRSEIV